MSTLRVQKLNSLIKELVATIIQRELKDPRISGLLSVTRVSVSPDVKNAEIFVSIIGTDNEIKSTFIGLKEARGFIRSKLRKHLVTKYIPMLKFIRDDSIEKGVELVKKIDEIISGSNQ